MQVYPDPESGRLRELLADYTGVPAEQILCGAGADELIELILQLFIEPGDAIINTPPTFAMYSFNAPLYHARLLMSTGAPISRLMSRQFKRRWRSMTQAGLPLLAQ